MTYKEIKALVMKYHRDCCPYHHNQMGKKVYGMDKPVTCFAGRTECDDDCWYMNSFKDNLKHIKP